MPFLFSKGIEKSILVSTPEEALALKKDNPELLLAGEVKGVPIDGFDFGNSPWDILKQSPALLNGRTVVQRSSAGVQGAIAAIDVADEVLISSYTNARGTVDYVLSCQPEKVSVVAMGVQLIEKAPEDEWCAAYICHLLGTGEYDHSQALMDIIPNKTTQKFFDTTKPHFPPEDPILCLQRDMHHFALKAEKENGLVVTRKVEG
jgi:2-phosphosulfolactate phosphatase